MRPNEEDRQRERDALGLRLTTLRMRVGLTQVEVAEFLGVRQATVSAWENGVEPRLLDAKALARLYKVSLDVVAGEAPFPGEQ